MINGYKKHFKGIGYFCDWLKIREQELSQWYKFQSQISMLCSFCTKYFSTYLLLHWMMSYLVYWSKNYLLPSFYTLGSDSFLLQPHSHLWALCSCIGRTVFSSLNLLYCFMHYRLCTCYSLLEFPVCPHFSFKMHLLCEAFSNLSVELTISTVPLL